MDLSCESRAKLNVRRLAVKPPMSRSVSRSASACIVGLAALSIVLTASAIKALGQSAHVVRQKDLAFLPREIALHQGETIAFLNDEGRITHHAYVEADAFSFGFNTGDQEPGTRTEEAFTTKGTFTVLCGIHPKMKLTVRVD